MALGVLAEKQQVFVVMNRKTLEASLIAVPLATGPIVVLRLVELVRPGGAPVAGVIPPSRFAGVSWSAQAVVRSAIPP